MRSCFSVFFLEAFSVLLLGVSVSGVAAGGDSDDGDGDDSSSYDTDFSVNSEPEGWVVRFIIRDVVRGCYFYDAFDILLRRVFNRRIWFIEYCCVVYQYSRGVYPDRWEVICLVRCPENSFQGAEVCSEYYFISERDSAEVVMQDAVRRAFSYYCSVFGGVADGFDLKYYFRRLFGSTGGMIVLSVGEVNFRLSSTVNLVVVLNTELDYVLDEMSRVRLMYGLVSCLVWWLG
ncbi:hypothetical protein BLW95_11585 [Lacticaseibacillus paracasei]|nr:hypothetical protein BLW95_11585 [Lacticaseibacillus paracasei]